MQRLRFLVWKEFLELRLNPRLFGVVVIAPIIQLTMLGYAATTDVRDVPVIVADRICADATDVQHRLTKTSNEQSRFNTTDLPSRACRGTGVPRTRTRPLARTTSDRSFRPGQKRSDVRSMT